MRALRLFVLACLFVGQCSTLLLGAEYRLNNGDVLRGEAVSFNDDGLVVRLEIGGHSTRISWSKITQETLQLLAKDPLAARFVEPFIEVPPVPKAKNDKKKEIKLKPVERVERVEKPSFFSSFATPAGLAISLVLLLANVYAAFEIARYRYRSPGLICALSVVLPVLAPLMVLALPPAQPVEGLDSGVPEPAAAQAAGKATTGPLAKAPMAHGLSIAQGEKAGAAPAGGTAPQVFKRGEFTFNRRFMETKFPGFFRVVQTDADRDLVLAIRTGKDEHIAKRISRISSNEMHVLLSRGPEVSIAFADIIEISMRHKDAKA